jgi:hypothetical protein
MTRTLLSAEGVEDENLSLQGKHGAAVVRSLRVFGQCGVNIQLSRSVDAQRTGVKELPRNSNAMCAFYWSDQQPAVRAELTSRA